MTATGCFPVRPPLYVAPAGGRRSRPYAPRDRRFACLPQQTADAMVPKKVDRSPPSGVDASTVRKSPSTATSGQSRNQHRQPIFGAVRDVRPTRSAVRSQRGGNDGNNNAAAWLVVNACRRRSGASAWPQRWSNIWRPAAFSRSSWVRRRCWRSDCWLLTGPCGARRASILSPRSERSSPLIQAGLTGS
jgi:hypothetical protein